MSDKNNRALVPRPQSALEKAAPGAKRILSGMVADTLALRRASDAMDEWCRRGETYYYGIGVQHNASEAVKWFQMAANEGLARAQCWLGYCYHHSCGVEEDVTEGLRWFRKAAKQGEAVATYNLGLCYEGGLGVAADRNEMVVWYRTAADLGHLGAHLRLGILGSALENGRGLVCDPLKAIKWYHLAAERGLMEAQRQLATCYEQGQSVRQNLVEARRWYEQAAEQGDAEAQRRLAAYIIRDSPGWRLSEAFKWLRLSVEASGGTLAENELDALRSSMKPEQIEEGEKLVCEFYDRKISDKFWFPRQHEERPFEPSDRRKKHSRMDSLRIVILDDEPGPIGSIKVILSWFLPNAEILTFTDVNAALEELEREDPDLFTTDFRHPGIRGHELLRILAVKKVKYPIFVLSAVAERIEVRGLVAEFDDQLNCSLRSKPFVLEDFRGLLAKHFGPDMVPPEP